MLKLNGKISLITGAGRGIGRAIAIEFAREGSIVYINDINKEFVDDTCKLLKKEGLKCYPIIADVGNYNDVKKMFEQLINTSGRIDILVNNAAILRDKTIHNMDISYHWDDVIRINLTGVFYCCKKAIENMRVNNFGRIINMSSVIGICGNFGQTAYSASKAGVIGFTKSLAYEGARYGITVNAIAPGFIQTEMISSIPDEIKEKILARIPLGKFGSTTDIAKVALFLASDDASYITGQVIGVNGGYLMP